MAESKYTHRGCRFFTPNLEENTPVMNGSTTLPTCPNPVIQLIEPVSNQRSSTRPAWFIAMGYMGPRTNDTATASPITEGTNQMTIPRLRCGYVSGSKKDGKKNGDIHDCEKRVDEENTTFTNLAEAMLA